MININQYTQSHACSVHIKGEKPTFIATIAATAVT